MPWYSARAPVYVLLPPPHVVSETGWHLDGVVGKSGSTWDGTSLPGLGQLVA